MAKRNEDRHGRGGYRRDRDRADDRGYMDRAGDEVRSWFGDDDAEYRRRMDEQRDRQRENYDVRDRDRSPASHGNRPANWERPEGWRDRSRDDARFSDWGRTWGPSDSDRSRSSYSGRESGDWNRERDRDRGWSERGGYRGVSGDDDLRRSYDSGSHDWRGSERSREWQTPRPDWSTRQSAFGRDERSEWGRNDWGSSDWSLRDEPSRADRPGNESRSAFGPYRGRGPKGYQRADNRILEDVCDRLTYSDVDAENIEVRVENGEVTLSGSVRDRADKRRAEDVAEEVSGVRDVHNNIRVQREDRGIGQSEKSTSSQPGTVLGVNPTADANTSSSTPASTAGTTDPNLRNRR
jgi:osmotically-inducible protein OsmY